MTSKKDKLKNVLKVFLIFLKIGTFTFGGGYAMISLLENEFVEKRKWITSDEFFKIVTVAESTPGPIAINSATYIGYNVCGVVGSLLATLGVVLPSFIIMFVISLFFNNLLEYTVIANAFRGIKVGVAVLILLSGIKMMKSVKKNVFSIILLMLALSANLIITLCAFDFSTIYLILIGGALGFVAFLFAHKKELDMSPKKLNPIGGENTNSPADYIDFDNISKEIDDFYKKNVESAEVKK